MKKFLIMTILLIMGISTYSQITYSPNTYYLIAPTSGCNGVWAIKDTIACATYLTDPCWQLDHFNGDTLFLKLCSIPCSFYATTVSGDPCVVAICSSGGSTGITDYGKTELEITWQENNIMSLKNSQEYFDKVSIISITGQVIKERINIKRNENLNFDMNGLSSGLYIVETFKNGERINTKKITIN